MPNAFHPLLISLWGCRCVLFQIMSWEKMESAVQVFISSLPSRNINSNYLDRERRKASASISMPRDLIVCHIGAGQQLYRSYRQNEYILRSGDGHGPGNFFLTRR
ncbi:hypothetical protein F4809DRAFT_603598, partial [Biscogniauxia mediterranea]